MKRLIFIFSALLCSRSLATHGNGVLRDLIELDRAQNHTTTDSVPFAVKGTVALPSFGFNQGVLIVSDSACAVLRLIPSCRTASPLRPGDVVFATGTTLPHESGEGVFAAVSKMEVLGHQEPPQPEPVTVAGLAAWKGDGRFVRVKGLVREVFRDEVDPQWTYIVLQDGHQTIYAVFFHGKADGRTADRLIGSEVSLSGFFTLHSACRRLMGRILYLDDSIRLLQAPLPSDPFAVPEISSESEIDTTFFERPERRRIKGRVIAVWEGIRFLMRTCEGKVCNVHLAGGSLPVCGQAVEVSGLPATDLYRIHLTHADWRPASVKVPAETAPESITPQVLATNIDGTPGINTDYHGRAVRMKGRLLERTDSVLGRLTLDCDGTPVSVLADAAPVAFDGLEAGYVVEITGVCLMKTALWQPAASFPHVEGSALIVRDAEDVRVIARPPWWTPARLLVAFGTLLLTLVGIGIWNLALRRRAEKRGQELANEQIARASSELKIHERTRLAVELHDSISQTLTGVSMEIDAAGDARTDNPSALGRHLELARKAVDACRIELRNTLWDLRSQALEEEDMNQAIRMTLCQNLKDIDLAIRFNVPRARLLDNTAHTVLRIVRELVANAIRHGQATRIRIAGSIEDNRLLFSVIDNGCGFDPDDCPGVPLGHFGLQGIRERIARLNGHLAIESRPGEGTRVAIALSAGQDTGELT